MSTANRRTLTNVDVLPSAEAGGFLPSWRWEGFWSLRERQGFACGVPVGLTSLFDPGAVRVPQGFRRYGERIQSSFEDVSGGVHVGVRRVRAFLADEDRLTLAVLLVHMPASAACLARVLGARVGVVQRGTLHSLRHAGRRAFL